MKKMKLLGWLLIAVCLCCASAAAAGNADQQSLTLTGGDTAGLELVSAYPSLQSLTLVDYPVCDLTPLASCSSLTELTIEWTDGYAGGGAYDLAPLKSCALLSTLTLIGQGIADLSGLPGVARLKTLTIRSTAVVDFSPVESLGLKHLRLYGADAQAVTRIFTAIGRKLDSTSVGDCTLTAEANDAILACTRLISLRFEGAQGIDGNSARWKKLSNLTSLSVVGGSVSGLEFLDTYVATVAVKLTDVSVGGAVCSIDFDKYFLKTVNVPDAELLKLVRGDGRRWQYVVIRSQNDEPLSSDAIAALSHVSGLISLDVQACAANAFAPDVWEDFAKLEQLKLADCSTVSLDMLFELPNLLRLSIRNTAVNSASKIGSLRKLEQLSLENCTVDDWSFLNALENTPLTLLSLSGCNGPASLEFARNLRKLNILALENAPISDLHPLSGLGIASLYLYGCDIADYAPLQSLPALKRLSCNADAALPALSCRVLRKPVTAQGPR